MALDSQFDETADGRRLKRLNVVDEHTWEGLACVAGRSVRRRRRVAVIERLTAERGTPGPMRMDNPGWSRTGAGFPSRKPTTRTGSTSGVLFNLSQQSDLRGSVR